MGMRVATSSMFDSTPRAIGRQQAAIAKTQAQISSGRRIQTPSDDPSGAARVIDLRHSLQMMDQIKQNQTMVRGRLEGAESAIASGIEIMQGMLEKTNISNNQSLTSSDLRSIAATVRGSMQELAGLANSTDSEGKFIFSGYATETKPFVEVGGVFTYQGDSGRREAQVGLQRKMQVNDPGGAVFEGILSGNGTFSVRADATNAGTAIVNSATVQDHSATTGDAYAIVFDNSSGTMRYDVVNTTSGATVSSGTPYTSGSSIQFDGVQVSIKGAPAHGDRVTATPSSERSVFAIITELADALEQPIANDVDRAELANELFRLQADLTQGMDRLIDVRTGIGTRLTELDTFADIINESTSLIESGLANVEDLDYASAITQLSKQQTVFQAAQMSYMKMIGTNLFEMMR